MFQRSVAQKSSWTIWPWRWWYYAPAKRRNCLTLEEGRVCFFETMVVFTNRDKVNTPGDLNIFQHRREKLLSTEDTDDSMIMLEVAWKVVGISAYD